MKLKYFFVLLVFLNIIFEEENKRRKEVAK